MLKKKLKKKEMAGCVGTLFTVTLRLKRLLNVSCHHRMVLQNLGSVVRWTWFYFQIPPLNDCVTAGRLLYLSGPQFSHEPDNRTCSIYLLWGWIERIHRKYLYFTLTPDMHWLATIYWKLTFPQGFPMVLLLCHWNGTITLCLTSFCFSRKTYLTGSL